MNRKTGFLIVVKVLLGLFLWLVVGGCTRSAHTAPYINFSQVNAPTLESGETEPYPGPSPDPDRPDHTPTPDPPRPLPTLRSAEVVHTVRWGENLKSIARRYRVLPADIAHKNGIADPNLIYNGQQLEIPVPKVAETGPSHKLIPDSELVYGPYSADFQIAQNLQELGGYAATYREEVDGRTYTGPQIIQRVAMEYSVNPRLLIALLEHQTGWATRPEGKNKNYPLKYKEAGYEGLYRQLAWAANQLNSGYYLWRVRGVGSWLCTDGINVPVDETINAGTAALQHLFSFLQPHSKWREVVSAEGFITTYRDLFGSPFAYTYEPLVPADLTQPPLQLPFEQGVVWSFTGGPHGGWGSGSAWAAIDFAPPPGNLGCVQSKEWVVAAADGEIVYANQGAVLQSIDGDPYPQTGWTLLYMHIASSQRVEVGTFLKAGERIGHPSCEGGVSTGTHLHLARRYNGEWIPADQNLPFNLEGWISRGDGAPYQGSLVKNGRSIPAEGRKTDLNLIQR